MPTPRRDRYRAARRDPNLVVVEGFHAVKHALRFGAGLLEIVAAERARVAGLAERLAPDVAEELHSRLVSLPADRFAELSPQPHPTGVMALATRPTTSGADLLRSREPAPLVYLERPAHLGNLGAAIRVAAAAGALGVLSTGTHDPWGPESVRAAAGLQFALPVARIEALPASRRPLVAVTPEGRSIEARPIPAGCILAFGSEREGLDPELRERAIERLAIPMTPGVSSLNVATAVAVTLYAWRRPS